MITCEVNSDFFVPKFVALGKSNSGIWDQPYLIIWCTGFVQKPGEAREKSLPLQQHLLLSFNVRKKTSGQKRSESEEETELNQEALLLLVEHTTTSHQFLPQHASLIKYHPSLSEPERTVKDLGSIQEQISEQFYLTWPFCLCGKFSFFVFLCKPREKGHNDCTGALCACACSYTESR